LKRSEKQVVYLSRVFFSTLHFIYDWLALPYILPLDLKVYNYTKKEQIIVVLTLVNILFAGRESIGRRFKLLGPSFFPNLCTRCYPSGCSWWWGVCTVAFLLCIFISNPISFLIMYRKVIQLKTIYYLTQMNLIAFRYFKGDFCLYKPSWRKAGTGWLHNQSQATEKGITPAKEERRAQIHPLCFT
jgi:hypothetical protein